MHFLRICYHTRSRSSFSKIAATSSIMKTIQVYQELKQKVRFFYQKLNLSKYEKTKGRKLAISILDTITLSIYRQASARATKKSLWNDFQKILNCSYKTLVVNMNKYAVLCLQILQCIFLSNRKNSHLIKHTDSTDIPVCLNKNAKYHQTMKTISSSEWYLCS